MTNRRPADATQPAGHRLSTAVSTGCVAIRVLSPGMPPAPPAGMNDDTKLGPVTKYAVLGVLYGLVAGTLWATLSGQYTPAAGALGGFVGGIVGGTAWGLSKRLRRA